MEKVDALPQTVAPKERKPRVLVVDDDRVVLKAVGEILRRAGCEVVSIEDGVEGLSAASEPGFAVAMLDIKRPHVTGMDILKEIKSKRPEVEVVMMTAFATVETAVAAVKGGAYDYLTKPFENIDDVVLTVQKAFERKALLDRNRQLEGMLDVRDRFEGLIGQGPKMQAVFRLIEGVAYSSATVLVMGESGTGKELAARALHYKSPRRDKPFVAVNCSALTETLLESELFGHVRGAFTGAVVNKKGLFEAADGGTLFLDEIGDIPPSTQVRLLRALQEGEIKRVGSNDTIKVDVRVIAATNRDLGKLMAENKFREDLYYRLNVIAIHLPPLRERPEDIPLLVHHFLTKYGAKTGKQLSRVEPSAMEALTTHRWSGNVRELENVVERAVVLAQGDLLCAADLPPGFGAGRSAAEVGTATLAHLPYAQAKKLALRAFERRYLSAVLSRCSGNISSAARAAGVDRSNFRRLLKQYEVERDSNGNSLSDEPEDDAAVA
ncbi:MAG: sigma-54-dependent Fis family transcriptional regulator [Deltaproteobacteria bacterium]|nr:sigma-54-dependent Fis family transcriptional regulator [Deltaproteobacteria bacterium]